MEKRITLLPGDGIGPEIVEQAVLALEQVAAKYGHTFITEAKPAGGAAIDATGNPMPDFTVETCRQSDAVLLGAVGGPKWDALEGAQRPEAGLLRIRKELGLFANLRPAVLYDALRSASPLRPDIVARGMDILIVRELTGGLYFGKRGTGKGASGREAFDTETYDEREIRRVARVAFALARNRRKKVTSVDKANVLASSRLWRDVVIETAAEFPDISLEHMYVDNAAMQIVREPSQFDVVVTTNMFGDIISDEASVVTGSIGMLPSASMGETTRGLYEPIHGSAPDIAGQNRANPIATILSVAMMLRNSFALLEEAWLVERAVSRILARGFRTADIMSQGMKLVGTREMGGLVAAEIAQN
ncbi:MAG: 3-isopropylmalate dehydrogenase [Candidatus Aminicenantales bacterium]